MKIYIGRFQNGCEPWVKMFYKDSWSTRYYSFDGGNTWYSRSLRLEGYLVARAGGNLTVDENQGPSRKQLAQIEHDRIQRDMDEYPALDGGGW